MEPQQNNVFNPRYCSTGFQLISLHLMFKIEGMGQVNYPWFTCVD